MTNWKKTSSVKQYYNATYPKGLTVLITGANSGLGYEMAHFLAACGVHVVITCRTEEKCKETQEKIRNDIPDCVVDYFVVEISDDDSMTQFVNNLEASGIAVDIFFNNAGISTIYDYTLSKQGNELNFQVNFLSTIKLTRMVLPYLRKCNPHPYVLFMTSLSITEYSLSALTDEAAAVNPDTYEWRNAYARSKFFLTGYVREWQKKETDVTFNLVDPGIVMTNISRNSPTRTPLRLCIFSYIFPVSKELCHLIYAVLSEEARKDHANVWYHSTIKDIPEQLKVPETMEFIYNYSNKLIPMN